MILSRDTSIVDKLAGFCISNPVELRCKHIAALVDKNKIISLGMNQSKSDPGFYQLSKTELKQYSHAEWNCLKGAGNYSRYTLYSVRVNRNGILANAKPCEFCEAAILGRKVGRVIYTIDRGIAEL